MAGVAYLKRTIKTNKNAVIKQKKSRELSVKKTREGFLLLFVFSAENIVGADLVKVAKSD